MMRIKNDVKSLKKYIEELEARLDEKKGAGNAIKYDFNDEVGQKLLNNIPLGIIILEVPSPHSFDKNKIASINKYFTEISYLKADEIIGKNVTQIISKKHLPVDLFQNIFTKQLSIEFKTHLKDTEKHFLITAFNLDNERALFTFNDYTRLKEAEDTIVYERNLFQTLLNKFPDSIYFKDKKARFLRASLYLTQIFHTTPNEIIGKTDFNFYDKELAEKKFADDMHVIKTGIPIINKEEKGSTLNGNLRWLSTTKLPLFNRKGEIEGLFGISRDITDKKIAEEREGEYKNNLITLTSSALDLLKMDSKKEIFNFLCSTLEKKLDHSIIAYVITSNYEESWFETSNNSEQALKITNLLNKNKIFDKIINEKSINDKLYQGKIISCTREGKNILKQANFETLFDELKIKHKYILSISENKKITGLFIIFLKNGTGLTDKNFVDTFIQQASLIIHRKNLEEQLIVEKERAEESDNLKTSFLANLSHEIRTPINAIQGFGELLKIEDLAMEKKVEYIDIIQEKSNQLIQIITDIIDISKFEANQVKVNETKDSLNEFLKSIVADFEFRIDNYIKKDIPLLLETYLPNDESIISTDFSLLKQIITNLITNAIKFTHKGIIELGYTVKENYLRFYVQDTGIGIPPEKRELIFERFRQVDESRTRKYGGTGLGLAISKSIIELMHGKIWVEEALYQDFTNQNLINERIQNINQKTGYGSRFVFTIPYKPYIVEHVKHDIEKEIDWSKKHILIVEDDSFNFQYIDEVLSVHNPKISHCKNGQDAITYFTENQDNIDLILMDLQMPVMDGFDATREIRKHNPKVPIIVQTAYSMPEDIKKSKEAGSTDYIVKPYNSNNLIDKIQKYL